MGTLSQHEIDLRNYRRVVEAIASICLTAKDMIIEDQFDLDSTVVETLLITLPESLAFAVESTMGQDKKGWDYLITEYFGMNFER